MSKTAFIVPIRNTTGLDLQLDNLRWAAADSDFEIHLYAIGPVALKEPPGCQLHRVEPNRDTWRDVHDIDVPMLLASDPSISCLVFSQTDQYFIRPISVDVKECVTHRRVILTSEYNGFEILSTDQSRFLYPRVHEVGSIIPAHWIREAKRQGISLAERIENKPILTWLAQQSDKRLDFKPMQEFPEKHRLEVMLEFSIWCFLQGVPWSKRDLFLHWGGTDRMAHHFPEIRDPRVSIEQLRSCRDRWPMSFDQIATTLAHWIVADALPLTPAIRQYLQESSAKERILKVLDGLLQENMTWIQKKWGRIREFREQLVA